MEVVSALHCKKSVLPNSLPKYTVYNTGPKSACPTRATFADILLLIFVILALDMAPTPVDNKLPAEPSTTSGPERSYWNPGNIAMTAVAAALVLGVSLAIVAFLVHRRRQNKKIAQQFVPAKESLLASEERKSAMFSRERVSSVPVYVDNAPTETTYNPVEPDPAPPVPLHINTQIPTPAASTGSGVSSLSRNSRSSVSSTMLSPVSGDSGASRPRSTSYSSLRYYSVTPGDTTIPVPKIIRTVSD